VSNGDDAKTHNESTSSRSGSAAVVLIPRSLPIPSTT
jgi:hypothetical protein